MIFAYCANVFICGKTLIIGGSDRGNSLKKFVVQKFHRVYVGTFLIILDWLGQRGRNFKGGKLKRQPMEKVIMLINICPRLILPMEVPRERGQSVIKSNLRVVKERWKIEFPRWLRMAGRSEKESAVNGGG
jgi:hypothetical protein